jgi:hypothetical protein
MDEKPPNSIKPSIQKLLDSYEPRPISELTVPQRKVFSPHPRVQRMFKHLLALRKQRESQATTSKK